MMGYIIPSVSLESKEFSHIYMHNRDFYVEQSLNFA